jgi:hypothetical protein
VVLVEVVGLAVVAEQAVGSEEGLGMVVALEVVEVLVEEVA